MNKTINNQINDIAASDWTLVLSLFDELSLLTTEDQQLRLQQLQLPESAKVMLIKMLNIQHQPNLLDQTIDPLVEALLGEETVNLHVNPSDIIGRTFGAWKAINSVGVGGMGQVFVAERADGQFEKQVALKVIKSGHFSELSQQRFLAEMRTLAQFEHPNIAHLIDGGTNKDGIVYFIMELIDGVPIVDYTTANNLALNERIELVLQVVDAVEYAHQSLVIHGDIKPANILVNQTGQVKLVDFGISRSLDDEKPERFLPQFTPSYSAPEQAQGKSLTTASDVFGVCAVLYELCSGSSPRSRESLTTQVEFTEKLNTPITATWLNYQSNRSQKQGALKGKDFSLALSQELGAIIDKGLQVEATKRYKNTTELRRELLLFQEGSAVPSFADNWLYKFRKTMVKYKWPVALSVFGVVVILATAMVAINQASVAQQEAQKAFWANQFLLSIFDHADPIKNQQKPITVNQLTAQAATQILQDKSQLPIKATALEMLSQIQYKLGEIDSAEQLVKEQINLMQLLPMEGPELAAVYIKAGNILESQDKLDDAIKHYRHALNLAPLTVNFTEASIRSTLSLANCLLRLNEAQEAEELISVLNTNKQRIEMLPAADSLLATLYSVNANVMLSKQQFSAAITELQLAKKLAKSVTTEAMLYPQILGIESDAQYENGQLDKAAEIDRQLVEYFSQNFGEDHPETIDNLGRLAVSLASLGELNEAIIINQRILANFKGTEIKGHQIPAAYMNIGTAYQALGDDISAIENYHKAQELWPKLTPRIIIYEASTEVKMAQSYLNLEQFNQAHKNFSTALDQIDKEYGKDHPMYARFQIMYAPLLLELEQFEEASAIIPAAYQRIVDVYGKQSKNAAVANLRWAQLNVAIGQPQLAAQQADHVIEVLDVKAYRKRHHKLITLAQQISQKTK